MIIKADICDLAKLVRNPKAHECCGCDGDNRQRQGQAGLSHQLRDCRALGRIVRQTCASEATASSGTPLTSARLYGYSRNASMRGGPCVGECGEWRRYPPILSSLQVTLKDAIAAAKIATQMRASQSAICRGREKVIPHVPHSREGTASRVSRRLSDDKSFAAARRGLSTEADFNHTVVTRWPGGQRGVSTLTFLPR